MSEVSLKENMFPGQNQDCLTEATLMQKTTYVLSKYWLVYCFSKDNVWVPFLLVLADVQSYLLPHT